MALPIVLSIVGNSKVNETHMLSNSAVRQFVMGFMWEVQSPVDSEEVVPFDCLPQGWGESVSCVLPGETSTLSLLLTLSLRHPHRLLTRSGPKVIITSTIWSSLYMPALGAKCIFTQWILPTFLLSAGSVIRESWNSNSGRLAPWFRLRITTTTAPLCLFY